MRATLILLFAACAPVQSPIAFQWVARKIALVPMSVGGIDAPFVIDTGVGLTLIDDKLCLQAKCKVVGTHTGRKPNGQPFTVPVAAISSLCLRDLCQKDVLVGVLPMIDVGGLLSLKFFEHTPFTVDYRTAQIVIEDDKRLPAGQAVTLRVEHDGPSLLAFLPVGLPGGDPIAALIDTGAEALVLDSRLMKRLAIEETDPAVRTVFGRDPTGAQYVRYFATLPGPISVTAKAQQRDVSVVFQAIVHDGLIGHAFLRGYTITYDLPHDRVIFH